MDCTFIEGNFGPEGQGGLFPGRSPVGLVVAVVVVGGAAPEVGTQAEVRIEQVVFLVRVAPDDAEGLVEDQDALPGFDPDFRFGFRFLRCQAGLIGFQRARVLDEDLVRGNDRALCKQRQGMGGLRLEEDPVLAAFPEFPFGNLEGEFLGALGGRGEGELALPHRLSVPLEAPTDRVIAQVLEIESVNRSSP